MTRALGWFEAQRTIPRTGKDQALAPDPENRILLENYYLLGHLERRIEAFVGYYNNHRYHESPGNVTPVDVYYGRDATIIKRREKIKKLTIQNRRFNHRRQAA